MNRLLLYQVGKRFQKHWIFRKLDLELNSGDALLINGPNGSGKSTLLKTISGWVSPNEGTVHYFQREQEIPVDTIYEHLSICAPYLELIEEFTIAELLEFHQSFKPLQKNNTAADFAEAIEIDYQPDKPIKSFSSGMKQRVKLGLTLFGNSKLVLLDEPIANLDKKGVEWYKKNIESIAEKRLVVVCSNDLEDEHFFCTKKLNLTNYKHHKN